MSGAMLAGWLIEAHTRYCLPVIAELRICEQMQNHERGSSCMHNNQGNMLLRLTVSSTNSSRFTPVVLVLSHFQGLKLLVVACFRLSYVIRHKRRRFSANLK